MQFYFFVPFLIGYFVTYFSKDSFWALLVLLIIATIFGSLTATELGVAIFCVMFIGFFMRKIIRYIEDRIKSFF